MFRLKFYKKKWHSPVCTLSSQLKGPRFDPGCGLSVLSLRDLPLSVSIIDKNMYNSVPQAGNRTRTVEDTLKPQWDQIKLFLIITVSYLLYIYLPLAGETALYIQLIIILNDTPSVKMYNKYRRTFDYVLLLSRVSSPNTWGSAVIHCITPKHVKPVNKRAINSDCLLFCFPAGASASPSPLTAVILTGLMLSG